MRDRELAVAGLEAQGLRVSVADLSQVRSPTYRRFNLNFASSLFLSSYLV